LRKQLHISGIGLLFNCAQAWYQRYILGRSIPPASALHIGTSLHKGVEADLMCVMEDGALADEDDLCSLVRDFAISRVNEEGVTRDEGKTKEETVADIIDTSVQLAKVHHEQVAPSIKPKSLERGFVIDMEGKFPFDLAGMMDIVEVDNTLRDTKSSKRKPTQATVDDSIQMTSYRFALRALDGEAPPKIKMDYIVKTKKPYAITLETTRTDEDEQRFLRVYEAACKQIEAECWSPCNPDHWLCNPKWCGYFNNGCPYRG